MRLPIVKAEAGYIEHGHLYGFRCFRVVVAADGDMTRADRIIAQYDDLDIARVHIVVSDAALVADAGRLAAAFHEAGAITTIAFPPHHEEQRPRCVNEVLYDSVLVVREGELFTADQLKVQCGSVSVHHWPGAAAAELLSTRIEAPYGYFLVLRRHEIGTAKVWLNGDSAEAQEWQIAPFHPLNDAFEAAEIEHILDKG